MGEALPAELQARAHDLGPQMEPALVSACEGRLTDIHWFQTSWQRGGSATAYAKAAIDGEGEPRDVVVEGLHLRRGLAGAARGRRDREERDREAPHWSPYPRSR